MSAEERIRLCRLLEKMEEFPEYSRRLGIKDASRFLEKQITEITGKQREDCDEKVS